MTKPFINEEQLQNLKQLLQSNDATNQQLAISLLRGFKLPSGFLKELRSRYPMICLAHGFYLPFKNVSKISLDIQHYTLPTGLRNYKNARLEELSIDMSEYYFYPHEIPYIWHLTSLKKLAVKGNIYLQYVSESIGQLTQLESLTINNFGCNFNSLPDELCHLTRLKYLSFENCRLEGLPLQINRLKNLEVLNLQGNWCLEGLPDSIRYLEKLKVLDLRRTGIRSASAIDAAVKFLPNVEIFIHPLDIPEYV